MDANQRKLVAGEMARAAADLEERAQSISFARGFVSEEARKRLLQYAADIRAMLNREVFVIVTKNDEGEISDLEVLDDMPRWDTGALEQEVYVANINGGDSLYLSEDDIFAVREQEAEGVR